MVLKIMMKRFILLIEGVSLTSYGSNLLSQNIQKHSF